MWKGSDDKFDWKLESGDVFTPTYNEGRTTQTAQMKFAKYSGQVEMPDGEKRYVVFGSEVQMKSYEGKLGVECVVTPYKNKQNKDCLNIEDKSKVKSGDAEVKPVSLSITSLTAYDNEVIVAIKDLVKQGQDDVAIIRTVLEQTDIDNEAKAKSLLVEARK